jgi:phosphate transport system permease protein
MFFLIKEGIPLFKDVKVADFIFGKEWYPVSDNVRLGIMPLIISSVYITILASMIAIPISLAVAIYIAELAGGRFKDIVKSLIEIIASIPSVVIGFFGMVVLAPFLINNFNIDSGLNLLNASLLLAFTAIPTITSISEDAISSIPISLKEASFALGANKWQTVVHIVIPASLSGIWTAIILGVSRIIGETMIVLMVAGGAAVIPKSIFAPVRPLTSNVAAEMAEAAVGGIH